MLSSDAATAAPEAAPAAAISKTSRITVAITCPRDAPTELRIAISRSRWWSCARVSPAVLATAISSNSPTEPNISSSARRYSPTRCSLRSPTIADQSLSVCGNCSPNSRSIRARSACACSIVTPGFIRPTPVMKRFSRIRIMKGASCAGSHASVGDAANSFGITPTIVYPLPPNTSVFPMAFVA